MAMVAMAINASSLIATEYAYANFKNIYTGLGANAVRTVCQDPSGLIWMGTENGLYYYDGYQAHPRILDRQGEWNTIHCLLPVDDKYLYIGTGEGLAIYNLKEMRYEETPRMFDVLHEVRALKHYGDEIWIGTKENGLFSYNTKTQKLKKKPTADGRAIYFVFCIETAGDRLFAGGYDGLYELNARSGKMEAIAIGNGKRTMVNSLFWDARRRKLLIGTEGLLYTYEPATKKIEQNNEGMGNSIKSIAKDGRGNLLLATDAGLFVYNDISRQGRFVNHDSRNSTSLANDIVWHIFVDRSQNVWFATGQGVSLWAEHSKCRRIYLAELTGNGMGCQISTIHKTSNGDYWLGGENGLIHVGASGSVDWFRVGNGKHSLRHNHVRDVFEDSGKAIWIASDGGVARYDSMSDTFVYYDIKSTRTLANTQWSYDICEDSYGRLWIASFVGGLFALDRTELLAHNPSQQYMAEPVAREATGGLAYKVTTRDGQEIWTMTKNGVIAINAKTMKQTRKFNDFEYYYNYEPSEWSADNGKIYRTRDGKRTEIASPAIQQSVEGGCMSVFKDADNDLLIVGGSDCLATIPIEEIEQKPTPKAIFITSLSANGAELVPQQDYSFTDDNDNYRIEIKTQSSVQMDLSNLDYESAGTATFYYKIDNSRWNSLEQGQNKLLLAELSGGSHTLSLCSVNPEENDDAKVTTYKITMPYPWYACPLAKAIYALLVIAALGIALYSSQRRNKTRIERSEREKTLELSKMKVEFFEKISHELKTPLSLIIALLNELKSEAKDGSPTMSRLATIHDNAKLLDRLINQILGIKQMEAEAAATNKTTITAKPGNRKLTEADEAFLGKVVSAIDKNMTSDGFGVQQLAAAIGVEQKQLYRKVKQLTDMTPVNYIRKLKMQRAASLLDQQRFSVSEVMYMVGFTSSSYFSKCFAEEYGMTPKAYANRKV